MGEDHSVRAKRRSFWVQYGCDTSDGFGHGKGNVIGVEDSLEISVVAGCFLRKAYLLMRLLAWSHHQSGGHRRDADLHALAGSKPQRVRSEVGCGTTISFT